MRLLSQSTRTTLRTLTLLFALTSLLLTMMTPFVGSAEAGTVSPFNATDGELDPGVIGPVEDQACGSGDDTQPIGGSVKINDIHGEDPPVIESKTLGAGKSDLCNLWTQSTVDADGDIWLYLALSRFQANGSQVTYIELFDVKPTCDVFDIAGCNPFETRNQGSRVIAFDFLGNDDIIDAKIRTWNGTSFDPLAELGNGADGMTGNNGHFAELSVNLTDAEILPNINETTECDVVAAALPYTVTGNDDQASMIDILLAEVAPISNCGSLEIIKKVEGGDDFGATFPITASGPELDRTESLGHDDSFTVSNVFASDDYSVSEDLTGFDGWMIESIVCSDSSSSGAGVTELTGITVAINTTTTCIVTNTPDLPTITLAKVIDGDDITENDFQASVGGGNVDWDDPTDVAPGDHTIAEAIAAESDVQASWYEASDWTCTNGDGGAADGATVSVALGDDVTCTITNTQLPTTLTLHKVLPNDDGGTAEKDDFQAYIDGIEVDWDEAQNVSALVEHTASEATLPGYTPGSWTGDCAEDGTVTLDPGEDGDCTITNDDDPPSITVLKDVTTDDGGTAAPGDFELLVDDTVYSHEDTVVVAANADVTVGEHLLDGYQLTDITCTDDTELADGEDTVTLNLSEGEDVTCTIFNDDIPPTVTLEKDVTTNFGGTAEPGDFELLLDDDVLSHGDTEEVMAGEDVTVGENMLEGYRLTDIQCTDDTELEEGADSVTLNLELDEHVTCIIFNEDLEPGLTVFKDVTTDNGGDAQPGDFALLVNGDEYTSGDTVDVDANVDYVVGEDLLEGYELTDITCTDETELADNEQTVTVNLDLGEQVTCTVFNDDIAPTVTVNKFVTNDDGGDAEAEDFELLVDGQSRSHGDVVTVDAHTDVVVGETLLEGYEMTGIVCSNDASLTGEGTVTFQLEEGEDVSCTIFNNDVPPTVTVFKEVTNDNGGDLNEEDVTLLVDDEELTSGDTVEVDANTDAIVGEELPEGYVLQSITCDDGTELQGEDLTVTLNLDEGEDVVCTVVNDDLPPAVTIVKTVTNDDGGEAEPGDFELFLDGEPVVSGNSNETTSNEPHEVSETQIDGYAQVSLDCVDDSTEGEVEHPVVLEEGQTVTCTIVNDDLPPGLTVFKDVVNDDEGTAGPEDFTLLVNGDGYTHGDTVDVDANTDYTVSEELLDDYELVDIECTDGTTLAQGESSVVVNLDNDESVGCTITNDDVPPVIIVGEVLGTVEPVCEADAAYLNYEAFTQNVDGETVTIHWFDANGVEQHTDVVDGLSGQVLWPGAEVDDEGFATDWPGFVFDGEVWEEGDDGFGWANGAVTVTLEVNPTTEPLTATYPSDADAADGEDCLPPEVEVAGEQFEQPAPELPRTGFDTTRMALWAALLAGLGALILLATDTPTATVRKRR